MTILMVLVGWIALAFLLCYPMGSLLRRNRLELERRDDARQQLRQQHERQHAA